MDINTSLKRLSIAYIRCSKWSKTPRSHPRQKNDQEPHGCHLQRLAINQPTGYITDSGDVSRSSWRPRPGSTTCFRHCFFKVMPVSAIYLLD